MKNILLLAFCFILYLANVQSQDTTCIEKRVEYFSETDTIDILSKKAKNIYYKAKYAKEFIRLSVNKGKIEYCFYYDNQRFAKNRETHFYLENNEITISEYGFHETWTYQKLDDNYYQITKRLGNIKEVGCAKNLMPLEKIGDFYAIDNAEDTLYKFEYENYIWSKSIKTNTDTFCDQQIHFCETDNLKELQRYFNSRISKNHIMPSLNSRVLSLMVIEFSILENGEICNINIVRKAFNPFFEKAVLNVFGEKGFKYLVSNLSNCKVRLVLKEPYF